MVVHRDLGRLSTIVLVIGLILVIQYTVACASGSTSSSGVKIEISLANSCIYIKILNANASNTVLELVGVNATAYQYPVYTGVNITVYRIPIAPSPFTKAVVKVSNYTTIYIDLRSIIELQRLAHTIKLVSGKLLLNVTKQSEFRVLSEAKTQSNASAVGMVRAVGSHSKTATPETTTLTTTCVAASKATGKQSVPKAMLEEGFKGKPTSEFRNTIPVIIGVIVGLLAYALLIKYY